MQYVQTKHFHLSVIRSTTCFGQYGHHQAVWKNEEENNHSCTGFTSQNSTYMYRMIKKSPCTWWLQYRKLQVMFKVSPASLQTFVDTPNCVLEDRVQYSTVHLPNVFCLKYCTFACFFYCNRQVHWDFLITLYYTKYTKHSIGNNIITKLSTMPLPRSYFVYVDLLTTSWWP